MGCTLSRKAEGRVMVKLRGVGGGRRWERNEIEKVDEVGTD